MTLFPYREIERFGLIWTVKTWENTDMKYSSEAYITVTISNEMPYLGE